MSKEQINSEVSDIPEEIEQEIELEIDINDLDFDEYTQEYDNIDNPQEGEEE